MAMTGSEHEQQDVVDFLSRPETHAGVPVEIIVTHISRVFLAGDRVYKLKRAVALPYADFSTLEKRRAACETEIEINQRTAPSIYDRVIPVTREADGELALDGDGMPVEWLTGMRRFPADCLFDRLALEGEFTEDLAEATARTVAALHESAPPAVAQLAPVSAVVRGIIGELKAHQQILGAGVDRLAAGLEEAAAAAAPLLQRRISSGFVREVHGDLHLGNIVLLDGQPTPFDAIEFDPALRVIDVFYDAAFLIMDLLHRGLPRQANRFLAAYLQERPDFEALRLLPLFLAMRAAIRAHVTATRARAPEEQGGGIDPVLQDEAVAFLDLAQDCLMPRPPRLVAVSGLSGSGKTTLARNLAPDLGPRPGAVILRSDEIRKRLAGVPATRRLAQKWYRKSVSKEVFRQLAETAQVILDAGHGVVADGVYGEAGQRAEIGTVANTAGVDFCGLWLAADADLRAERVDARRGDASDATAAVALQQKGPPPEDAAWDVVDAGHGAEVTEKAARQVLEI